MLITVHSSLQKAELNKLGRRWWWIDFNLRADCTDDASLGLGLGVCGELEYDEDELVVALGDWS